MKAKPWNVCHPMRHYAKEGITPFVKHLANVQDAAQRTMISLPARPFHSNPSMWMPFATTREYVAFLQVRRRRGRE